MTMRTKDRLAADLQAAGASAAMVARAKAGHYDDFESDSPTPIRDLIAACRAYDRTALHAIADAAICGEYDGTKAEADAWFAREGKDLLL